MNKQPIKIARTTVVKPWTINKKEIGMLYLRNPKSRALDVFPKDLAHKVCVNFTCKGKECLREACTFLHPRYPKDMARATVEAIAQNFAATKKGWLSDYHFCRETLPTDVKAMLGGLEGPTNSKRE